jgi:hypothetical protein
MGINMQGFTRGFADEEKRKDKTRAEMAQLWRETKKENPYASPSELRDILDAAMGGAPAGHAYAARQGLPTDEVIERLGASNKIKRDFDHRGKQLEQMIKQQNMEEGARKMFQKDILNYSLEDIRSGAAREKMRKSHPQMFDSINGMESLVSPSQFDEWTSENVWKREQGQWQASKLSDIKSWIQQNPEGSAQELAETMSVPVHVVQGPYDFAKKTYDAEVKKVLRDDKRAVLKEMRENSTLADTFNATTSSADSRRVVENALAAYYDGDQDLVQALTKNNPDIIEFIEESLQAKRDKYTIGLNKKERDAIGKKDTTLLKEFKERNKATIEGWYGKLGTSFNKYGDVGHAVSSYMNTLADTHVIDINAMKLLDKTFHEAEAAEIKDIAPLAEFVAKKNIPLLPIGGFEALEAHKNAVSPLTQSAQQWAKDVTSELHKEQESIKGAIKALDISSETDPATAIQEFKGLLASLQMKFPMGGEGMLATTGSVRRAIVDDINTEINWRTGDASASDLFRAEIERELSSTEKGVQDAMKYILSAIQRLTPLQKEAMVQNLEGGTEYPAPKRAAATLNAL